MDHDELNKEMVLDIFYSTKGDLNTINKVLDAKLGPKRVRKISLFEKYVKTRLELNPRVLKLPKFFITPIEAAYLSQYPMIKEVEVLDLRQNDLGDEGMEVLVRSPLLQNLRELDLRNNQITREGVKILAGVTHFKKLEKLDLRANQLGKRWMDKLPATGHFPALVDLKIG